MKPNMQLEYSDEMLHYLYSSLVFQNLSEKDQQYFLKRQKNKNTFFNMLQVAISLNEVIKEVESIVDAISDEVMHYFKKPRYSIRNKLVITENVYKYPFGEPLKEQGPLFICLQQGNSMQDTLDFCKGMMFPLFDVCQKQKRDLIIIPFSDNYSVKQFLYNSFDVKEFEEFIDVELVGQANLLPVLEKVRAIWESSDVREQSEVMIVTNNELSDYDEERYNLEANKLKDNGIVITAVAMSKCLYDKQPLHFLDKVFYVNE